MIGFNGRGNEIVETWSGRLTGETMYRTRDGRVWTSEHLPCATGVSYASLVEGRMVNERACDCEAPAQKQQEDPPPPINRHERRAAAAKSRKEQP